MKRYLARRLLLLLVSLIGCLLVIFVVLRLLPGDPANALLGPESTAEQIAAARARVGSDQPIATQLVTWLQDMARLDFGTSFTSNQPVLPEIGRRMLVTLPLTLIAFVLSCLLATVLGFLSACYARRWYGSALSGLSQLGVAIPSFWVGIILVWIFALWLGVAPAGGFPGNGWATPELALRALCLPVVAIVIGGQAAVLTRYVRAATLDVLSSGRVICGVGAGHVAEEFDLMGPAFDERGPATDEAVTGLALGLTEEYPTLPGPRWPASGVGLRPRPTRTPRPPIWVGGSSPAALRRTARYGDGWLPQSVGPNVELLATLRDLRAEYRDGAPLDIGSIAYPMYLGTPPADNELPPGTVQGTADVLAEHLRPYREAGCGQVQVRFPAHSVGELCDQIASFGAEVAPLVNG